jgi:DNA-binding transcriptional LysR family regulator
MKDTSHAQIHTLRRWDDLRVFLACVREGSFSAAAQVLQVEQSTVSRRIKELERELGAALFRRTPEGVQRTEVAEKILEEAEAVESHITSLLARSRGQMQAPRGVVRLAITESMSLHWLLPLMGQWKASLPEGLSFELLTGVESLDLRRGEADIALRFFRPQRGNLVARRVAVMENQVLAHPDYWEKHKDRDWKEHRWLTLNLPFPNLPEQAWFEKHIGTSSWLRTNSYASLIEGVRHGLGLAVLTSNIRRAFPELMLVETPFPAPDSMELWMIAHKEIRRSPAVEYVWEMLEHWCTEL